MPTFSYRASLRTDPIVARLALLLLTSKTPYKSIAKTAGVASSTVHNIASGKTIRPQHLTVVKLMISLGFEETWKPIAKGQQLRKVS